MFRGDWIELEEKHVEGRYFQLALREAAAFLDIKARLQPSISAAHLDSVRRVNKYLLSGLTNISQRRGGIINAGRALVK